MGFLQKAKGLAEDAAKVVDTAATKATDPSSTERLRAGISNAAASARTAVERIDPGVLADLIIKATALQERANARLRDRGSVYRIGEMQVTASIPPGVSFGIIRVAEGDSEDSVALLEALGETETDSLEAA